MSETLDIDLPVHPFTGLTALGIVGGRPVWPALGGAPEDDEDDDGGQNEDDQDDGEKDQDDDGGASDTDDEDDQPLGPKGEKALRAEKDRRRSEAKRRRELEAELAELKNSGAKDDPDHIRREATQAATAKANTRIVRAEVRAVAAGKLADPKDALRFLDLDQFEVDEDGDVDSEEVADAIDNLLKSKPYLGAAPAKRFQGTGDGGAARKAAQPKQLTREELKRMNPEQIVKAKDEGRLNDVLGINR